MRVSPRKEVAPAFGNKDGGRKSSNLTCGTKYISSLAGSALCGPGYFLSLVHQIATPRITRPKIGEAMAKKSLNGALRMLASDFFWNRSKSDNQASTAPGAVTRMNTTETSRYFLRISQF